MEGAKTSSMDLFIDNVSFFWGMYTTRNSKTILA